MALVLQIEQVKEFLGTLKNASQDSEVREALKAYEGHLHSRTDEEGHKLPIIKIANIPPHPPVTSRCLVRSVDSYKDVTADVVQKLLENLRQAETTDEMQQAVDKVKGDLQKFLPTP